MSQENFSAELWGQSFPFFTHWMNVCVCMNDLSTLKSFKKGIMSWRETRSGEQHWIWRKNRFPQRFSLCKEKFLSGAKKKRIKGEALQAQRKVVCCCVREKDVWRIQREIPTHRLTDRNYYAIILTTETQSTDRSRNYPRKEKKNSSLLCFKTCKEKKKKKQVKEK